MYSFYTCLTDVRVSQYRSADLCTNTFFTCKTKEPEPTQYIGSGSRSNLKSCKSITRCNEKKNVLSLKSKIYNI